MTQTYKAMPDIGMDIESPIPTNIDWVGMCGIDRPQTVEDSLLGAREVQTKSNILVNLKNPKAKGIHMSRLYLATMQDVTQLNIEGLFMILRNMIQTQDMLSDQACMELRFPWVMARQALLSDHRGWKSYPVTLRSLCRHTEEDFQLHFSVPYSSTCPCSAALARQLIEENFQQSFAGRKQITVAEAAQWLRRESSINATPHAQRSWAHCQLRFVRQQGAFPISINIDRVEAILRTAVQTVVKRQDEQEFARLNGENLMFCEDAVRRLQQGFEACEAIRDYAIQVVHMESLHPHDAIASVSKGIPGGFKAIIGTQ